MAILFSKVQKFQSGGIPSTNNIKKTTTYGKTSAFDNVKNDATFKYLGVENPKLASIMPQEGLDKLFLSKDVNQNNNYDAYSADGTNVTRKYAGKNAASTNAALQGNIFPRSVNNLKELFGQDYINNKMGYEYSKDFATFAGTPGNDVNTLADDYVIGKLIHQRMQGQSGSLPKEYNLTKGQYLKYKNELNNVIDTPNTWKNTEYYFGTPKHKTYPQ